MPQVPETLVFCGSLAWGGGPRHHAAWPWRGRINLRGQQACRAQEMPLCDPNLVQRQVVEPRGGGVRRPLQGRGKGAPAQLPFLLMD